MPDCKLCSLLAAPDLGAALPNLLFTTPTFVVVLNRRPLAPGHVTIMARAHRPQNSALADADLAGLGSLVGNLSTILERRFAPNRVILVGDGKPSAHLHFHLLPETPGTTLSFADAVADLNAATRAPTLTDAAMAELLPLLRTAG